MCIIHNGKTITSPKMLSQIFNEFFISKINAIRNSFQTFNITPMQILEKLTPKYTNKFILPEITLKEMHLIIKKT